MNPEELRIGNYVNYGSGITDSVVSIDCKMVHLSQYSALGFDDIQGIPLTEEWFVKNCDLDMGWLNVWKAKIEYVHQLQNLYYALTGEELILNV